WILPSPPHSRPSATGDHVVALTVKTPLEVAVASVRATVAAVRAVTRSLRVREHLQDVVVATVVVATGQRRTNAEIQMRQPVEDFFPPDWRIFMFYCLLLRSLT